MAVIDVGDGNFRELYKNNDIVVLDFWASWCGPCHQFSSIFESVAKGFPDIIFGKVNTEEEQKLSLYFGIKSIPTILVIREELEVYRGSGMSEAELKGLIGHIEKADMNEIREKINKEA